MPHANLIQYCEKTGLELEAIKALVLRDPTTALQQIYHAHVTTFPYSNFEIRKAATEHPVLRGALTFFNHKGVRVHGGYCFQLNAHLHSILKQLGFNPTFSESRVLVGAPVNDINIMNAILNFLWFDQ